MTTRTLVPCLGLILLSGLPFGLFGARARDAVRDGRAAYERGDYEGARSTFETGLTDYPGAAELLYDRAAAEYKAGAYEEARATLAEAVASAEQAGDADLEERAHFAAGNAWFMEGRYEKAIEAYDRALAIDPEDQEAIENRALAEKMLEPPPMQQQEASEGDAQQQQQSSSSESEDQAESGESDSESQSPSDSGESGESSEGGQQPESGESESRGRESQDDERQSGGEGGGEGDGESQPPDQPLQGPYANQGRPSPPAGTSYQPMTPQEADDLIQRQKRREQYNAQLREGGVWDPMADYEDFEKLFGQGRRSRSARPPW